MRQTDCSSPVYLPLLEPFASPGRHLVHFDVAPQPRPLLPRLIFHLLELRSHAMLEATVRIGLAIPNKIKIQIVGIGEVKIREQPTIFVACLRGLEPDHDAFALHSCSGIVGGLLGKVSGLSRIVTQFGGINPEQANDRILVVARPLHPNRIAVHHFDDDERLLVEIAPVVPLISKHAGVIEDNRN